VIDQLRALFVKEWVFPNFRRIVFGIVVWIPVCLVVTLWTDYLDCGSCWRSEYIKFFSATFLMPVSVLGYYFAYKRWFK